MESYIGVLCMAEDGGRGEVNKKKKEKEKSFSGLSMCQGVGDRYQRYQLYHVSLGSLLNGQAYYWKLKTSHHSAFNYVIFSLVYENVRWKYLPFIRYHTPINPMMCRPLPLAKYESVVSPLARR